MIISSDNTDFLNNSRFIEETIGKRAITKVSYSDNMHQFIITGDNGISLGISYQKVPFKNTGRKHIKMGWAKGSEMWFEKAVVNCLTANEWKNTGILIKMAKKEIIHDGITCKIAYGRVVSDQEKIRDYIIKKSLKTGHPLPKHIQKEVEDE